MAPASRPPTKGGSHRPRPGCPRAVRPLGRPKRFARHGFAWTSSFSSPLRSSSFISVDGSHCLMRPDGSHRVGVARAGAVPAPLRSDDRVRHRRRRRARAGSFRCVAIAARPRARRASAATNAAVAVCRRRSQVAARGRTVRGVRWRASRRFGLLAAGARRDVADGVFGDGLVRRKFARDLDLSGLPGEPFVEAQVRAVLLEADEPDVEAAG